MSHSHINKAKSSSKISHINVLIEFQSYKSMRGERKTPPKLRLLMNELLVNAYERIQLFFFVAVALVSHTFYEPPHI